MRLGKLFLLPHPANLATFLPLDRRFCISSSLYICPRDSQSSERIEKTEASLSLSLSLSLPLSLALSLSLSLSRFIARARSLSSAHVLRQRCREGKH
jgi:hypothetical protein